MVETECTVDCLMDDAGVAVCLTVVIGVEIDRLVGVFVAVFIDVTDLAGALAPGLDLIGEKSIYFLFMIELFLLFQLYQQIRAKSN